MILNGVIAPTLSYVAKLGSFGADYVNWLKIHQYFLRQKCSTKNLVFSAISFMAIFAEITENECVIRRRSHMSC